MGIARGLVLPPRPPAIRAPLPCSDPASPLAALAGGGAGGLRAETARGPLRAAWSLRESRGPALVAPPCLSFPGGSQPGVPPEAASARAVPASRLARGARWEARDITRGWPEALFNRWADQGTEAVVSEMPAWESRSSEREIKKKVTLFPGARAFKVLSAAVKTRALVTPYSYGDF